MRMVVGFLFLCTVSLAKPYTVWNLGYMSEVGLNGLPTSEMASIGAAMGNIEATAVGYELNLKAQYSSSAQMFQALAGAYVLASLEWPIFNLESVGRIGAIGGTQNIAHGSFSAVSGIEFGLGLYFDSNAQEQWFLSYSMGGIGNNEQQLEIFFGFSIGVRYF